MTHLFLATIPAMVLLTFIITILAFMARIRYMGENNIPPQAGKHTKDIPPPPSRVRQIMDNYNHLFEQPVVFYAMVLAIVAAGHVDPIYLWLGWIYVALRVLHSIVQCTFNHVMTRFSIFSLCWLVLGIMSIRELMILMS